MLNIGPEKLVLILLVALVVLGPDKLPATARRLGNITNELRRMADGLNPRNLLDGTPDDHTATSEPPASANRHADVSQGTAQHTDTPAA